jgi:hypothetical protein
MNLINNNVSNEVNCAISALSRCKCGPESVDSCPVKSIYAAPNFVEVREFEDIVMIATKVKAYTVINDKSKTTHLTPSSGIFSLNLHQKEILQIGHVKIHGISKNVTHISHVSFESFTLPPEPSWVTVTFKESIVDKVDEFFIEIVVSLSVLLIITVLAFVTFCYCHFSK